MKRLFATTLVLALAACASAPKPAKPSGDWQPVNTVPIAAAPAHAK